MVEHPSQLDAVFGSLADPTRRDILKRLANKKMSVSEIAQSYELTFAAISKHLKILEKSKLVKKQKKGKQQIVELTPGTLKTAAQYLTDYEKVWNLRMDALEEYLQKNP